VKTKNINDFRCVFWPDGYEAITQSPTGSSHGIVLYKEKNKVNITCENSPVLDLSFKEFEQFIRTEKVQSILIVDTFKSNSDPFCVGGHVNRSGINLLRGKTPYNDKPMFPDMGHIYTPVNGFNTIVAHTVGPEYWDKVQEDGNVLSKWTGILAPFFYYLGLDVSAVNNKALVATV